MARSTHEQPPLPPFYVGMPVTTDSGITGTIVQVMTDLPDENGGIRIEWEGGGSTIVPQGEGAVTAGHTVVPSRYAETAERDTGMRGTPERTVTEHDTDTRNPSARTDAAPMNDERGPTKTPTAREDTLVVTDEPVAVPIIEEQIVPETIWRDAGAVTFHVRTESVPETVTYEDAREEVVVEELPVGRELRAGENVAPRTEGETTIIPVIREEVVMTTRRVLEKEIRVTKRIVRTPRTVEMSVRRQRVEVGGDEADARVHRESDTTTDTERPTIAR